MNSLTKCERCEVSSWDGGDQNARCPWCREAKYVKRYAMKCPHCGFQAVVTDLGAARLDAVFIVNCGKCGFFETIEREP